VWTCARCGRFVCEQCDRVGLRKLCRPCDAADPLLPRGGWLYLALFSLITTPFSLVVYVVQAARDVRTLGWDACTSSAWWLWTSVFGVATLAGLSLYAMSIVPGFLKRRRRAPVMVQRFWIGNLALEVVGMLQLKAENPESALDGRRLFAILIALAWWKYFRDSKHVEATFINE